MAGMRPFGWFIAGLAVAALALLATACADDPDQIAEKWAIETRTAAMRATAEAGPRGFKPEATPPRAAPTPTPLIAGHDVRPCSAGDLNAAIVGSNAATGGELLAYFGLGNKSSSPCRLSGPPAIELIDSGGNVIPITLSQTRPCPADGPCIFQEPLLLLPGLGDLTPHAAVAGQAALTFTWWTHDGTGFCDPPPPRAMAARFFLPGQGGEITVDVTAEFPNGIAPCGSRLGLFSFGPVTE